MIGDYVVFQKTQVNKTDGGGVLLLTTDVDTNFNSIDVTNISIHEQMGYATPVIAMDIVEAGRTLTDSRFNKKQKFWLSMSTTNGGTMNTTALRLASVKLGNQRTQDPGLLNITLNFVVQGWDKLSQHNRIRSWIQTAPEVVVRDLVEECGMELSKTEKFQIPSNIVQPNITNLEFLDYLKATTSPIETEDGVHYGQRIDGKFIFSSFDTLLRKFIQEKGKKKIPAMVLGQPISGISGTWKSNGNYPPRFNRFRIDENYKTTVTNGSRGIRQSYFDFDTGEYKVSEIGIDDVNSKMLCKNNILLEGENNKSMRRYYGSNSQAFNLQKAEVSRLNTDNLMVEIGCNFQPNQHIGDIISLMIPMPDMVGRGDEIVSVSYSGYYAVRSVRHDIDPGTLTGATTMLLVRQGYDKGKSGINTQQGKF